MYKARVEVLEPTMSVDRQGNPIPSQPNRLAVFEASAETIDSLRAQILEGARSRAPNRILSVSFGMKESNGRLKAYVTARQNGR